jgi:hypothetical protein
VNEPNAPDPLERLEQRLPHIPAAKQRQRLGSALDATLKAAQDHEGEAGRLEELGQFAALLRDRFDSPTREELAKALRALAAIGHAAAMASEEEALRQAREGIERDLPRRMDAVEHHFTHAWQGLIESEFSSLGALGGVLKQIPETRQIGEDMVTHRERARALAQRLSPQRQAPFQALSTERDLLEARLQGLGVGLEVKSFLLAAAKGQATLATLSPATWAWLEEHQALSAFRVIL